MEARTQDPLLLDRDTVHPHLGAYLNIVTTGGEVPRPTVCHVDIHGPRHPPQEAVDTILSLNLGSMLKAERPVEEHQNLFGKGIHTADPEVLHPRDCPNQYVTTRLLPRLSLWLSIVKRSCNQHLNHYFRIGARTCSWERRPLLLIQSPKTRSHRPTFLLRHILVLDHLRHENRDNEILLPVPVVNPQGSLECSNAAEGIFVVDEGDHFGALGLNHREGRGIVDHPRL